MIIYTVLDSIITILIQIFIFLYGGYLVLNNIITVGELSILSIFFAKLLYSVSLFFNLGQSIQTLKASMSRIEELMSFEDESNGNLIIKSVDSIVLEKVKFGYGKNIVIDDFNYIFEKGKIYSIYGKNGSGKSTLLDLIIGLYNNKFEGNIYYNGFNIKNISIDTVRKKTIAVCEQKKLTIYPFYLTI